MTRWASLVREPERRWLIWDPSRWWLPVPWEGVAVVVALCLVMPGLTVFLRHGRRSPLLSVAFIVVGFLWVWAAMWITLWWRGRRRRQLTERLRDNDWVCANCLHAESLTPP